MSTTSPIQQLRSKLQLLLKEYYSSRKQITQLEKEVARLGQEVMVKQAEIERLHERSTAKNISSLAEDADTKKELEQRINVYLKEIDKCLSLLKT